MFENNKNKKSEESINLLPQSFQAQQKQKRYKKFFRTLAYLIFSLIFLTGIAFFAINFSLRSELVEETVFGKTAVDKEGEEKKGRLENRLKYVEDIKQENIEFYKIIDQLKPSSISRTELENIDINDKESSISVSGITKNPDTLDRYRNQIRVLQEIKEVEIVSTDTKEDKLEFTLEIKL